MTPSQDELSLNIPPPTVELVKPLLSGLLLGG